MTKSRSAAQKAREGKRSIVPVGKPEKLPAARLQKVEVVDGVIMLTGADEEYALGPGPINRIHSAIGM